MQRAIFGEMSCHIAFSFSFSFSFVKVEAPIDSYPSEYV